ASQGDQGPFGESCQRWAIELWSGAAARISTRPSGSRPTATLDAGPPKVGFQGDQPLEGAVCSRDIRAVWSALGTRTSMRPSASWVMTGVPPTGPAKVPRPSPSQPDQPPLAAVCQRWETYALLGPVAKT